MYVTISIMLDDGCFFPFILMNLGKLKLFFLKNPSNWLMSLLKKLRMADVAGLAGFVHYALCTELQMHEEAAPLTVTVQASFRDIRVGPYCQGGRTP